ncbi:hypothetical protein N9Z86_00415 [bacterium]|nr:hypothetical protein [bacterium]
MSNSNTQLDLFNGVVLTTEQEQEINTWVENQARRAANNQEECNTISRLLEEAGFEYGKDFKNNFDIFEVTSKREFGYSYNNTNYEHEVTYMNAVGGVSLIINCIHEGEIRKQNASVDRDGNKLMCTTVTDQYRYYKPSSLLTRLKGYNVRKVSELSRNKAEKIAVGKIITKYKKLYPKAVVCSSTDHYRGSYTSFPIIKVKFNSGSEVSFTLGYSGELDKERFHKKYDAISEGADELLERFNKQPSK